MFALEVLPAKHGDCLMVHYGDAKNPRLMLVDGGPAGVYRKELGKRLVELRDVRSGNKPLLIDRVMISHMDHDHIDGVIDMLAECEEANAEHRTATVKVDGLWHNSFSDVIGDAHGATSVEAACVGLADLGAGDIALPLDRSAKLILQSVGEGRRLRDMARKQKIRVNSEFSDNIAMEQLEPIMHYNLSLHFLGPGREEVRRLRSEWDKQVRVILDKKAESNQRVKAAENLDKSIFNLASMVVLVEADGRRLLLTGDARSDHILNAIDRAQFYEDGILKLDILKIPHHGSDRNVTVEFFRKVQATHYVFSGDGKHDNPSVNTLRMLFEARPTGEPYVIHWTYDPASWKSSYPKKGLQDVLDKAHERSVPFSTTVVKPSESIVW